ncbi:glycosyltransferase [Caulobacter sp. NIBR1757]|uniref:glycosyltransferase n=1 Tax=Caulobacter sp. NIBR1757 TaxID=3016000 RepID=UPI0022F00809|nr:glycosyltransferase [Caulobacter sp. NIBR1757]WGM40038.1 D-inositol-3-phosphate glycosyltransferase [Caulobacter sp. NIBR1757]
MKILIYAPNYYPATRYGGPIRSSHGLAAALVRAGHGVQVFTTDVDGPDRLDVPLETPVLIDGVEVRYFPLAAPARIYHSPAMDRALADAAAGVDVIHTNGMFLLPGPRAAHHARRAGTPLVISPRGMLLPEMIAGKSALVKRAWISLLERRALSGAAAIHVTSEEEARGVRALGLDLAPLSVIGNGVDTPAAPPSAAGIERLWGAAPKGRRVAFLARLDWTKGADLAVEAVTALPGAHLLLAGPDQIGLRARLEDLASRAGAADRVRFAGQLDDAEKWALLAGADVLVAPSVNESFGLAVAEAMAMGVSVVTSPGVGASDIVRRIEPDCVVERNVPDLTAAIGALLGDPARRERFGKEAQRVMRAEFGWDSIAGRMIALYEAAGGDEPRGIGRQGYST